MVELEIAHDGSEAVEACVAEGDPVAEGCEHLGGGGESLGVLVDPQEAEIGSGLEQEPGVPGTSQRGIHQDPGWDRPEQVDDAVGHHRLVVESAGHALVTGWLPAGSLIGSPPVGSCRQDFSPG